MCIKSIPLLALPIYHQPFSLQSFPSIKHQASYRPCHISFPANTTRLTFRPSLCFPVWVPFLVPRSQSGVNTAAHLSPAGKNKFSVSRVHNLVLSEVFRHLLLLHERTRGKGKENKREDRVRTGRMKVKESSKLIYGKDCEREDRVYGDDKC